MRTLPTVRSASAPCTPAPFDPPPPLWIFIERGLSSREAVIVLIWQRKKRYPPLLLHTQRQPASSLCIRNGLWPTMWVGLFRWYF